MATKYNVTIGLEMHCEISETNSKVFSSASNNYSDLPNSKYRSNGKVIFRKTISKTSTNNYIFRMWYSFDAPVYKISKQFGCKVFVDAYYK